VREDGDYALAAVFTAGGIAVLVRHAASDTETIQVGFDQLNVVGETLAGREIGLALTMIIILTTLIVGAQSVSRGINLAGDLDESSSGVGLIVGRGNETSRHATSTGSIDVGNGTEGNSIVLAIRDGVDILFTAIVGLVSSARGQ